MYGENLWFVFDKNIIVLNKFLVKLGFTKQQDGDGEKKNKILGLFG